MDADVPTCVYGWVSNCVCVWCVCVCVCVCVCGCGWVCVHNVYLCMRVCLWAHEYMLINYPDIMISIVISIILCNTFVIVE